MTNSSKQTNNSRENSITDRITRPLSNPIISGIVGGLSASIITLIIEYRSGLFQAVQDNNTDQFVSPLWLGIAMFVTGILFTSILRFLHISWNSQKFFREDFSFAAFSTINWLSISLFVSLIGRLMFWHPVVALAYILTGQKLTIIRPSWEGYALLVVLILLFFVVAYTRHQNWDGSKSIQQYQREQRSEDIGIFSEGIEELKRILNREPTLEKHLESDPTQLLGHLEQEKDSLSQAWEEQARELIRLSSSSYLIEPESAWHDSQGCWVGQNVDTGNLIFLYPAQTSLSDSNIDRFIRYCSEVAEVQKKTIDELIVAFREDEDMLFSPIDLHPRIRFETEKKLLDKLVSFTDYYNAIRKRILDKLPESNLTLYDTYVPSCLLLNEKKRTDYNVEEYLKKWLEEPSQRQVALLGEYGQGKSSAALMFTYNLLFKGDQPPKRIPILIELRGKSPRDLRPLELLGAWASQYRIEPQALMRLHIAGRLVIIFEGFDEMALIGNSELRLRHFKSLWKFCYPNSKIIITGRPNFFLDDREMKQALGISKTVVDKPYCEAIRLAPFTTEQIRAALRNQKALVRDQICFLAEREARFLDLVSRPSLLHVVSTLWEKEKLYEKAKLLNSAYVMECFVRSSYRRQGLKIEGSRDFMALNSAERDYFMCGVASHMATNQFGNQIPNEHLNQLIDGLIEAIPTSVSTASPEIFSEDTRPLKLRIQDPKDDIEHIKTDVRTCGLLVDDPASPGTFKFGHKSFMEYLFASTVKEYIWDLELEKARAIKKVTNFPIETILDFPVSIDFLAEMIGTDSSVKENLSQSSINLKNERATADRLLNVIIGMSTIPLPHFMFRLQLFSFSYLRSRKNLLPFQQWLILIINPLTISMLGYTAAIYLLFNPITASDYSTPITNAFVVIAMWMSGFSYIYLLTTRSSFSITRKFRLWNSLCKELQINDIVLHQIAGTWFLPWARSQTFDYFLPKNREVIQTD